MPDGHYLNLPVMSLEGEIVGMVDVLKLTYATLDQINSMNTGDGEGPAWNKFWMSFDQDGTESVMSGEGSSHMQPSMASHSMVSPDQGRPGMHERLDSVAPGDSASHNGIESPEPSAFVGAQSVEETPFTFKFKAPSGRVHRLQVTASAGMAEFVSVVADKLGPEAEGIGGAPTFEDGKLSPAGFALSYLDNEGDTVSITTDHDLVEAITLARNGNRDKVDLFVHDPEKPPMSATVAPQPALPVPPTPPESFIRERKAFAAAEDASEEDEEEVTDRRRQKKAASAAQAKQPEKQVIAGVPNELLMPGAIVTLAVVIITVFTISRATSK